MSKFILESFKPRDHAEAVALFRAEIIVHWHAAILATANCTQPWSSLPAIAIVRLGQRTRAGLASRQSSAGITPIATVDSKRSCANHVAIVDRAVRCRQSFASCSAIFVENTQARACR